MSDAKRLRKMAEKEKAFHENDPYGSGASALSDAVLAMLDSTLGAMNTAIHITAERGPDAGMEFIADYLNNCDGADGGEPADWLTKWSVVPSGTRVERADPIASGDANPSEDDDYMCENCVTPWKCNGPHIPEVIWKSDADLLSLEDRLLVALSKRGDMSIGEFMESASGCDLLVPDLELVLACEQYAASLPE